MIDDDDDDNDGRGGSPAWMATFADLCSLLLTFFVLLLSFAELDVVEFQAALGSVKQALGVITRRPGFLEGSSPTPINFQDSNASERTEQGMPEELVPIQRLIKNEKQDGTMKLIVNEDNIVLRVYDLFPSATAELRPKNFVQMDIITALVRTYSQPVTIEAHTDDVPIRTDRFPSNWDLSAARAAAVARYLELAGSVDPGRLSPTGYASHKPLVPNDGPENRAKNRRVEIILARKTAVPIQVNDSTSW